MFDFAAMNEFQPAWIVVFLGEALLFGWLYEPVMDLYGKKRNVLICILLTAGYVAAKCKLEGYIFLNILVMLAFASFTLWLFSDIRPENILWMAAVFTVCSELARNMVYGTIYITGNHEFYLQNRWLLRLIVQILKTLPAFLGRKLVCRYSKYPVQLIDHVLVTLAVVQLIFLHYRRMVSVEYVSNIKIETETYLVLGAGVIAMFLAMLYHIKTFLQEREMEKIHRAMEENYRAIQTTTEVDTEIRRIYHDLKQQLSAIDWRDGAEPSKECISLTEHLNEQVSSLERVAPTGSPLLDSLLGHKMTEAKERRLHLEIFPEPVGYAFIDGIDLCSIVGNAVDNAMEAACRIEDAKERFVRVKIAVIGGIWVLKVENTCTQKPVVKDGAYLSSKRGEGKEGIGIKSIRYCAQKYDGRMEIEADEKQFTMRVMIPVFD